jgi:DNA glycosylase AlkZ-like
MIVSADILRLRLANQRLTCPVTDPAELVAHLGAVQSQDYPAATWALGARLRGVDATAIDAAFDQGMLLRTHVLRPTWHFVAPEDIRWMLALSGPRIRAAVRTYTRSLGLEESTLETCSAVIGHALVGGKSLTRAELGAILRDAGLPATDGATLGRILFHAELEGLMCSGPRRGRNHTYALLSERAPMVAQLDRDAAVAELTWRYFNSHGPALVRDCAWWSGLRIGEINRGLEANTTRLQHATIDGQTYWFAAETLYAPEGASAFLLPNFDEYTVAYRERDLFYDRAANATGDPRQDVPFRHVLLVDGQVMGRWSASVRQDAVDVQLRWSISPSNAQRDAIEAAALRYATFVGLPCELQ